MQDRPKLTHVAIRLKGEVHSLPEPNRHADIVYGLIRKDPELDYVTIEHAGEFGFLDANGRFLNRHQAFINAELNDQIKDETKVIRCMLFSEAVW